MIWLYYFEHYLLWPNQIWETKAINGLSHVQKGHFPLVYLSIFSRLNYKFQFHGGWCSAFVYLQRSSSATWQQCRALAIILCSTPGTTRLSGTSYFKDRCCSIRGCQSILIKMWILMLFHGQSTATGLFGRDDNRVFTNLGIPRWWCCPALVPNLQLHMMLLNKKSWSCRHLQPAGNEVSIKISSIPGTPSSLGAEQNIKTLHDDSSLISHITFLRT